MTPPFPSREELRSRGYDPATLDQYDQWREANREAQALAARLPEVFGDPPRPKITLSVARGYDDEWNLTEERIAELSAQDPEQHWTEVSPEAVRGSQEYFTFSDAEGWRFYLPAFMQDYLTEFPNYGWDAVYLAFVSRKHVDLLTSEQLAFLDEFIALCQKWLPTSDLPVAPDQFLRLKGLL
ncbi:hypothetical protein DES53_1046 [Roseimicrobium gellanilyticum]|uniref:Uncharacterized protein n=1 Tax=Roseimicrobium gellanilyticum TaxID=748857 RepID=A0A366HM18_9BACT|nr:DUF6714 family protein [Roseimicrobium gellanilyticum]RBP44187.1 hypothetical protein DES53_1046 [Roseimicrobium gellanilyticum]